MSRPVLSVRNLEIAFPGSGESPNVVDGVSFDLFAGERVGMVGESGCGKSVTALALMGLLPERVATVRSTTFELDGQELAKLPAKDWQKIRGSRVAMVFQEPATAMDPVLRIGQQLIPVIKRCRQRETAGAQEIALAALQEVGFPQAQEIMQAYPHQLSGGMKQLVMIALAIAVRPAVLIADEPTTALDVTSQSLIIERLAALSKRHGTTLLLVSHDLGVIAQCCSRALVMYCGRLVEQAPYEQLFRQPMHPYTYGLLQAVPRLSAGQSSPAKAIPGRVPAISERPAGCHFAPRCDRALAECLNHYPDISDYQGTRVACHNPRIPGNADD